MNDTEIWDQIKSVREKAGITGTNFRRMKSNGRLPEKWVTPVYLQLTETDNRELLERLHALSQ